MASPSRVQVLKLASPSRVPSPLICHTRKSKSSPSPQTRKSKSSPKSCKGRTCVDSSPSPSLKQWCSPKNRGGRALFFHIFHAAYFSQSYSSTNDTVSKRLQHTPCHQVLIFKNVHYFSENFWKYPYSVPWILPRQNYVVFKARVSRIKNNQTVSRSTDRF